MQARINGMYMKAGQADACPAFVVLDADKGAWLYHGDTKEMICHAESAALTYSSVIPGLPVDLIFADGGVFTPSDPHFRWPTLSHSSRLPERLERYWPISLMAIVIIPMFFWVMVVHVIPAGARLSVAYVPDSVSHEMGEQTLRVLDEVWFSPSELSFDTRQQVTLQWRQVLLQLNMNPGFYQLDFRAADIGANAFALPDGRVIVTDDLIRLMEGYDDELTAILLHEIGHVQHQHGMQLVAQTTATSLLFVMMLGDLDGAADVLLGAGLGLSQNAFSRDMEREADAFALEKLHQLAISPMAFARAMRLLMESHGVDDTGAESQEILRYIGTHPGMQERIQMAEKAAALN